ncbi:MAG: hypothetical protein R3C28_03075 [Pirellulaceae bacterium]
MIPTAWTEGKNARKLQIEFDDKTYEFDAATRMMLPRVLLAQHTPRQYQLDRETVQHIISWVARKYIRSAFPDEFNERIRPAANKLRKVFKKQGGLLSAIFLTVSDEEFGRDQDYELVIFGAMRVLDHNDSKKRREAQKLVDKIEAELEQCDGIEVESSELRSEAEISLADIRVMKRWENDIDLTLREEGEDAVPPVG